MQTENLEADDTFEQHSSSLIIIRMDILFIADTYMIRKLLNNFI